MKKGKEILGVRSADLHERVKKYVEAANNENITISSVVRDAIREKIERLEAAQKKVAGKVDSPFKNQKNPSSPSVRFRKA